MAENILALKKQAVSLGMPKQDAMKANRATLTDFISTQTTSDEGGGTKVIAKKKKAKAAAQAPAKKKAGRKPTARKTAPARTAQKRTKAAPARVNSNGSGRLNLGKIDWTVTSDDWQPRADSGTGQLFKALKSSKGDVDKAFDKVVGNIWDFVGKVKRDGSKRTKQEAHDMLRYRLNRTKFDFAKATGQHQSASAKNRAVYGEGIYATTRKKKPARAASTRKAKTTTKTAGKRGKKATRR